MRPGRRRTGPTRWRFTKRDFATGFAQPLYATGAQGEPGRLYVVEQGGTIKVVDRGRVLPGTFLDIRSRVTAGGEQGLLGLAFHPSVAPGAQRSTSSTRIAAARRAWSSTARTATRAIPGSAGSSSSARDPYGNHNGGMLAFAPNGRLFFTMGDGGAGGDPENRAQNMRSLFGKLLSINVATKGLKIEALGLRNAWRFSFDRVTNGDLYIADVGQGNIEEVN